MRDNCSSATAGTPVFGRSRSGWGLVSNPPSAYHLLGYSMQMCLLRSMCIGLVFGLPALALAQTANRVEFNKDIRPILSEGCFNCHGPNEGTRQAGLRFDVPEGPTSDRGRYGGPVIIPGDADESLLLHRVTEENERARMPRGRAALRPEQIDTLRRWIDQGAEYQDHWAFIPPERAPAPSVGDAEWPRNPIDRFILARLEDEGLTPSDEADRATLLRRVPLDLPGVPPPPPALADFLPDASAAAGDEGYLTFESHSDSPSFPVAAWRAARAASARALKSRCWMGSSAAVSSGCHCTA